MAEDKVEECSFCIQSLVSLEKFVTSANHWLGRDSSVAVTLVRTAGTTTRLLGTVGCISKTTTENIEKKVDGCVEAIVENDANKARQLLSDIDSMIVEILTKETAQKCVIDDRGT